MRIALATLLLALAAGPAFAKSKLPPCPPKHAQLFLSPMGEPFHAPADAPYPVADWFARADANHDGGITLAEMSADADHFFAILDLNHDGEIDPGEMTHYERVVAPEIALWQRGPGPFDERPREKKKKKKSARDGEYGGPLGAGRYAFLNIPEPVAAADLDDDRGVDRAEFRTAAAARFRQLDKAQAGALTLAALPKTPAQAEATDCIPASPAPIPRKKRP